MGTPVPAHEPPYLLAASSHAAADVLRAKPLPQSVLDGLVLLGRELALHPEGENRTDASAILCVRKAPTPFYTLKKALRTPRAFLYVSALGIHADL